MLCDFRKSDARMKMSQKMNENQSGTTVFFVEKSQQCFWLERMHWRQCSSPSKTYGETVFVVFAKRPSYL